MTAATETTPASSVPFDAPTRRLSVIVPAYRDAVRIERSLDQLCAALDSTGLDYEVIVVVDGDPVTYGHAARRRSPRVVVLGYPNNQGKGFALRFGMSRAVGELITFVDSDMDIGPEEIGRMAALLDLYRADVVVGSKRHPLSEVHYPALRRLQSLGYQLLVRALFDVRVRDTQTGLKMMRREVAERVVDLALVKRFAFDLELLTIARHVGYRRIIEAPVRIDHRFSSTTNLAAVGHILVDTAAIWYRLRVRHWYDRPHGTGAEQLRRSVPDGTLLE